MKEEGTYQTVTATSSDGTTGYNDAPSLAKAAMAIGNVTVIAPLTSSLAADCTPAAPPTSGVHSSVMPLVASLQPGNVAVNETVSYTAAQLSTLVPPTCQTVNGTCCVTSPTGCLPTPTQSTGSVSLESQVMSFLTTWWPWILLILVVVAVTVAYAESRHHHRRR
jgi:hypothetical protein